MEVLEITIENKKIIKQISKIEFQTYAHDAYSYFQLIQMLGNSDYFCFATVENELVVGYLIGNYSLIEKSADVFKVTTSTISRKKGIAKMLFQIMCNYLLQKNIEKILIEVRSSNAIGIQFYISLGFVELTHRKEYYNSPNEDAIIMQKLLK